MTIYVNAGGASGAGFATSNPQYLQPTMGRPVLDITEAPYNAGGGGDDTAALTAALDDLIPLGGGDVLLPDPATGKSLLLSGAPYTAGGYNAQIPLPSSPAPPRTTIRILGARPLGLGPGDHDHVTGSVIKSTYTGWDPAHGIPSVIGGPSSFIDFNLVIEDVIFSLPANPMATAVNASQVTSAALRRVNARTSDSPLGAITEPTNPAAIAFRLPAINNHGFCIAEDIFAYGYYGVLDFGEHTEASNIWGYQCKVCLSPGVSNNGCRFGQVSPIWCPYGIAHVDPVTGVGASGASFFSIAMFDVEDSFAGPSWFNPVAHFYDPSNAWKAAITGHRVISGSGPTATAFIKNGATGVSVTQL